MINSQVFEISGVFTFRNFEILEISKFQTFRSSQSYRFSSFQNFIFHFHNFKFQKIEHTFSKIDDLGNVGIYRNNMVEKRVDFFLNYSK